nr:7265_t:CDS:2 [Entrophospora candida]
MNLNDNEEKNVPEESDVQTTLKPSISMKNFKEIRNVISNLILQGSNEKSCRDLECYRKKESNNFFVDQ